MSHYGLKIGKTQSPDKTPYTIYYPHSIPHTERPSNPDYVQIVSIDPGTKNFAFRIERRYLNGTIIPIVFDKICIRATKIVENVTVSDTYKVLTDFLDRFIEFYDDCQYIIIERQLPQNYKAGRVAQHTISYFSLKLYNKPLLPAIVEICPKLKGKMLGAPKNISDGQLKTWATEKAKELLEARNDTFSLDVLKFYKGKQDDLSDTVCQIEALFLYWNISI